MIPNREATMRVQPTRSLLMAAALLAAGAGETFAQSLVRTAPPRPPRAFAVPRNQGPTSLQLPPDGRVWTDKVTAELVTQSVQAGGAMSCIVVLREPDAVRLAAVSPADDRRLRWIADTVAGLTADYAGVGVRVRAAYSQFPAVAVDVPRPLLEALAGDSRVDMVQPDRQVRALDQRGRELIHQPVAQALGYDGTGVGIAIVDTGVDYTHQELSPAADPPGAGKVIKLFDAIDNDHDPMDKEGHGTSVAGIAAGTYSGVAPGATVVAVRVLDSRGLGFDSEILAGLNAVQASVSGGNPYKIKVLNLSLGGYGPDSPPKAGSCDAVAPAYKTAFDALAAAGVLVVAAAGNGGCDTGVGIPACVSSVMAVGATYTADLGFKRYEGLQCNAVGCQDAATALDQIACYSDSGDKLDVWAPSSYTKAPTPLNLTNGCRCENGTYDCCFGGTSAASPYVAGAAAVLFQAAPTATVAAIRQALKSNGTPITDARNGVTRNRLDLQDSLAQTLGGCAAPAAPTTIAVATPQVCLREAFTVTWAASAGAASYTVQLASDPGFAAAQEYFASTPTFTLALAEDQSGSFYVRTRANSACGSHSDWSPAVQVDYTPTCGTIAYTLAYFVPGAVRTAAAGAVTWQSDLSVLNPGDTAADVRLSFHGAATLSATMPLPAHQQVTWTDVLGTVFGVAGSDSGALVVDSTLPLVVHERTYSVSGVGATAKSYGQSFSGLPPTAALGWGHVGFLAGLRSDAPFHTDIELLNPGTETTVVEVSLFGADGSAIGSPLSREVAPQQELTLGSVLPAGAGSGFAEVRVVSTSGSILAVASVVDGNSGDPTTVPLVVP
jgi:subtilisin family serine protease